MYLVVESISEFNLWLKKFLEEVQEELLSTKMHQKPSGRWALSCGCWDMLQVKE